MFWLNMGSDSNSRRLKIPALISCYTCSGASWVLIAECGEKYIREFHGLKSVLMTGRKVLAKAAVRSENALLFRSPVTERQPRSLIVCPHHL